MPKQDMIQPTEAEHIASEIRSLHGLGQKYRLRVESKGPSWHVRDGSGRVDSVRPMPEQQWREYLERRFVEAITQHEETSEA